MNEPLTGPSWVDRLVVDAIHFDLVSSFGGLRGLRDDNTLESALARPMQKFRYEGRNADLRALAAAYGYGLVRNHPFHDGNKRLGFVVMAVFLGLNGLTLTATETDVVRVILGLAAGEISEDELAAWLRAGTT